MSIGVVFPERASEPPGTVAAHIEACGYDSIFTGELWGTDTFVRLAGIAAETSSIRLGTGIANVYSRSPATLASAAATLSRLANRPISLGLGPSTPKVVGDLHSEAFDRPITRLDETIQLIRHFLSDAESVDFEGDVFEVTDFPGLDLSADVPILNAALGPRNRWLTGHRCDGWIPHMFPFDRLQTAFEPVRRGAEQAGRAPSEITVLPYVPAAVSEDGDAAREALAGHIAYHVGVGDGYRSAVETEFPDRTKTVTDVWQRGDRSAARHAVTEEMIDRLGVAGTPAQARERLREIQSLEVIDGVLLKVPSQATDKLWRSTVDSLLG